MASWCVAPDSQRQLVVNDWLLARLGISRCSLIGYEFETRSADDKDVPVFDEKLIALNAGVKYWVGSARQPFYFQSRSFQRYLRVQAAQERLVLQPPIRVGPAADSILEIRGKLEAGLLFSANL